jgi:hypothetical protein
LQSETDEARFERGAIGQACQSVSDRFAFAFVGVLMPAQRDLAQLPPTVDKLNLLRCRLPTVRRVDTEEPDRGPR